LKTNSHNYTIVVNNTFTIKLTVSKHIKKLTVSKHIK
jgi:hypothetical protein